MRGVSVFTDPAFQARVKAALVWASEFIESGAEDFKQCSTTPDGQWMDDEDERHYSLEMSKVSEMSELLRLMHDE